jgi:hypothetical protein
VEVPLLCACGCLRANTEGWFACVLGGWVGGGGQGRRVGAMEREDVCNAVWATDEFESNEVAPTEIACLLCMC